MIFFTIKNFFLFFRKRKKMSQLKKLFQECFPSTKEIIVGFCKKNSKCEIFTKWIAEVFDYNLGGGKFNRGILLLGAFCRNF